MLVFQSLAGVSGLQPAGLQPPESGLTLVGNAGQILIPARALGEL